MNFRILLIGTMFMGFGINLPARACPEHNAFGNSNYPYHVNISHNNSVVIDAQLQWNPVEVATTDTGDINESALLAVLIAHYGLDYVQNHVGPVIEL